MKIGFTTFACPQWDLTHVLDAANHYGYHGVEFRCDAGHEHGIETWRSSSERDDIRIALKNAHIEPACLATSLQFVDEIVLEQMEQRITLAADIGFRGIRVFCGKPHQSIPLEEALQRCAFYLRMAAEMGEEHGVEVWLETHDLVSCARDAATVLHRAAHHLIGLTYDTLNPVRRSEPFDLTLATIDRLVKHVHFHDGKADPDQLIVTQMGEGDVPMVEIFEALWKMGYEDYLCGEWFHNQYAEDPDDALDIYQQEVVELGHKFGLTLSSS